VKFYTHLSDQFGPYHTNVIAASAHEAPHVLDGLLYHESSLVINEHYTDTGGFSDHIFAVCRPLGFRYAPRIRDLKEKRLYTIPGVIVPAELAPLVAGHINMKAIHDHWQDILRLVISIKTGTVTASVILRKLAAYPRQNGLALALRELGKLERTLSSHSTGCKTLICAAALTSASTRANNKMRCAGRCSSTALGKSGTVPTRTSAIGRAASICWSPSSFYGIPSTCSALWITCESKGLNPGQLT
jgi:hypothetical protein